MNFISKIFISLAVGISSFFGFHQQPVQAPVTNFGSTFNPTGGGTYRLQSSISTTQNTITLTSFKEPISGIKYTMSYLNSSIEYGTIDPQNATSKEFISFTGITQNSDGTALLTGVSRGLGFSYPYTASTTLASSHSGQSIFILSNPPQLTNQYLNMVNGGQVSGLTTFTDPPIMTNAATSTLQAASVAYVNGLAFGGAVVTVPGGGTGQTTFAPGAILVGNGAGNILASSSPTVNYITATSSTASTFAGPIVSAGNDTFSGTNTFSGQNTFTATSTFATTTQNGPMIQGNITNNYTTGVTIVAGNPVLYATSSPRVYKVIANVASTSINFLGIAVTGGTAGQSVMVQTSGIVNNLSGLTAGSDYYASDTGTLSTTQGTNEVYIGQAISSTQLQLIKREFQYVGTVGLIASGQSTTVCNLDAVGIPAYVRQVGVNATYSGDTGGSGLSGYMNKNGLTSVQGFTRSNGSGVPSSCTWSGTSVNCDLTSSAQNSPWTCSGTLYFYR